MATWKPVLLANVNRPNSEKITTYLEHGGYEALRKALKMTPDAGHRRGEGFGSARPRRRRLPHRRQVGLHAQGRPGQVPGVNTDEGEPGTFKDRLIVERDPHSILEGRHHRRLRRRRTPGLRLHPRRVLPGRQALDQGHRRRLPVRLPGQEHPGQRLRSGSVGPPRRGRLHLRRRDGHDRVAGRQTRRAPAQAALSRAGRPVGQADPRAERARRWPTSRTSSSAAPPGTPASAPSRARGPRSSASAGTSTGPATTNCRWARTLREIIYEHAGGVRHGAQRQGGHPRRRLHADADRRATGRADGLRDAARPPARRWAPAPSS